MTRRKRAVQTGTVDGGEGRGVKMDADEDEILIDQTGPLDGFEEFGESEEAAAERRRDPLRR